MEKKWNPDLPINYLPDKIKETFITEADFLLHDLLNNKINISCESAPELRHSDHKVRVITHQNPEWYSQLYHSHNHFRRDRTLKALTRICNEKDGQFKISPYKYDATMRELILERMTMGYTYLGDRVPPEDEIKESLTDIIS